VLPYRLIYCLLILLASSALVRTEAELDAISSLGTGVMLLANIAIMLVFGPQAMREYHRYIRRLRAGAFETEDRAAPQGVDGVPATGAREKRQGDPDAG